MQPNQPIPQYRTHLTLTPEATGQKEATATFTTPDLQTAKKLVTQLLGEETTYGQQQKNGAMFIYHPEIRNGKDPCGWVNEYLVPAGFDVKVITGIHLESGRVAA